jgi:hypothetical protein
MTCATTIGDTTTPRDLAKTVSELWKGSLRGVVLQYLAADLASVRKRMPPRK